MVNLTADATTSVGARRWLLQKICVRCRLVNDIRMVGAIINPRCHRKAFNGGDEQRSLGFV